MKEETKSTDKDPPWIALQAQSLLRQRGHAWLLHGPSGLGQYKLGLAMVRAWLCESSLGEVACGACESCHAIDVRTHADLMVLMPEQHMLRLKWPLSEKAQSEIDDKKRKVSKEIRVDALRDAIEFAQRTSSRGRAKAVLVFPAEQMNSIAANTLLKTLEEPPGNVKFVLATESVHELLPTIRSRCIGHSMRWPSHSEAVTWLQAQDIDFSLAVKALKTAGGRPDDALDFLQSGRDIAVWSNLRSILSQGQTGSFKDWSIPQVLDAMLKLCHDLMAAEVQGSPRYFSDSLLGKPVPITALTEWHRELVRSLKSAEHPFNSGLMLEALVNQAKNTLNCAH